MSIDPLAAAFVQDSSSGIMVPTRIRRTIIPYDDLSVLEPPTGYGQLSTDVITTLAVMAAQNGPTPRLVTANQSGQVYTASVLNYITFAASAQNLGDHQLTVQDPSFVGAGASIWIFPKAGSGNQEHGPYIVIPTADPHVIAFNAALVQPVTVGDTVISVPIVGLQGAQNNVALNVGQSVATAGATSLGGGLISGVNDNTTQRAMLVNDQGLPLGGTASLQFLGPTASPPSVTFLASAGFTYVVHSYRAAVAQNAAAAGTWFVQIRDSAGLDVWDDIIGVTATTGSAASVGETDMRAQCGKGKGVTLSLNNNLAANQFATLSLGVYLR